MKRQLARLDAWLAQAPDKLVMLFIVADDWLRLVSARRASVVSLLYERLHEVMNRGVQA